MNKKCGICEICKKQKLTYEVIRINYSIVPIEKTVKFLCSECSKEYMKFN